VRLKRPSVKSVESEECQCHAEQESGQDCKSYDHKTFAGVGVSVIVGSRNTESKEAHEATCARGTANNIASKHEGLGLRVHYSFWSAAVSHGSEGSSRPPHSDLFYASALRTVRVPCFFLT
jgi:hypothetical protein